MIINGVDSINLDNLSPGDNIKLKLVSDDVINKLIIESSKIGCKLIMLNYGEFYLKEFRSRERNKIIKDLLI